MPAPVRHYGERVVWIEWVTKKGGIKAMMRAIETTAVVGPDGALTIAQPVDVPAGRHRVILVIDEQVVPEDMAN